MKFHKFEKECFLRSVKEKQIPLGQPLETVEWISKRVVQFLNSKNPETTLITLQIMGLCIEALSKRVKFLLPAVAQMWKPFRYLFESR